MKFKVGDKVKVIKNVDEHKIGDVHIIGNFRPKSSFYDYGFQDAGYIKERNVELAESKPTKKERIKSLEETVTKQGEEINELKSLLKQVGLVLNKGVK